MIVVDVRPTDKPAGTDKFMPVPGAVYEFLKTYAENDKFRLAVKSEDGRRICMVSLGNGRVCNSTTADGWFSTSMYRPVEAKVSIIGDI